MASVRVRSFRTKSGKYVKSHVRVTASAFKGKMSFKRMTGRGPSNPYLSKTQLRKHYMTWNKHKVEFPILRTTKIKGQTVFY